LPSTLFFHSATASIVLPSFLMAHGKTRLSFLFAERVDRFVATLGKCGVPVMVRKRRGDELSTVCGQLRTRWTEPQGN